MSNSEKTEVLTNTKSTGYISSMIGFAEHNSTYLLIATVVLSILLVIMFLYYNGYLTKKKTTTNNKSEDPSQEIEKLITDINDKQEDNLSKNKQD